MGGDVPSVSRVQVAISMLNSRFPAAIGYPLEFPLSAIP